MTDPLTVESKLRDMADQILSRPSAGHELFTRAADLIANGERAVSMLRAVRYSMDSELPFPSMDKINEIIEAQK